MGSLKVRGQLSDKLRGKLVESKFDKTPYEFVPQGAFDDIFSRVSIMEAMNITQSNDALVDFVYTRARKVFATMAYIEPKRKFLKMAMSWFFKNNFHDRKLPIDKWSGKKFRDNEAKGILHPFASMEDTVEDEDDRFWTTTKIYDFQEAQFKFLAPVFSTDKPSHDLWNCTIPFEAKDVTYAEGSFGTVSKYTIHSDHVQDPMKSDASYSHAFAVKELKVDNDQDRQKVARNWASEVKAMATMNKLDHKDHIVRFITAFRRGTPEEPEHYLITEWADGGNLHDLWKQTPRPQETNLNVQEVIKQLLGLAEALNAAHFLSDGRAYSGASYRHGDLKPANILWFKEKSKLGTLKICDWGCAKNKKIVTAMRHSKTSAEYGTRRYQPPEIETGMSSMLPGSQEKRISRLYDIWSMGCIALEFIVWLLYGIDGLEMFNKSMKGDMSDGSPFYQLSYVGGRKLARVHNIATYWMNHMAEDPACRVGTTALGDLLEIVQRGLLVVKLPRRGGTFAENGFQRPYISPPTARRHGLGSGEIHSESAPNWMSTTQGSPSATVPEIDLSSAGLPEDDLEPQFGMVGPERLRADQLRDRLDHIATADEKESYWSTKPGRPVSHIPTHIYSDESVPDSLSRPIQDQVDYDYPKLDPHHWGFETDNKLATEVFSILKDNDHFPIPRTCITSNLCGECTRLRDGLWDLFFEISYDLDSLETRGKAHKCDLCGLLWRTCERNWGTIFDKVRFERSGCSLTMNGGRLPVLSIFRDIDCKSPATADLQIGFAELPKAGSPTHLEVVRKWLHDCDHHHCTSTCKPTQRENRLASGTSTQLPTRLIDVGIDGDHTVRLWETNSQDFVTQDTGGWISLSHRWGLRSHLCTTSDNVREHLTGMNLEALPATFKDAVLVTRALGRRYLWIDSICIIQEGDQADFEQESKCMEDVYSGAYCVIAATCATGHNSGFLKPRSKRDYVALRREAESEAPFYVCQTIDSFQEHVLEDTLNSRGWVLQEHALARRTVFFTEHQTYWECSHGVRCETMTELRNVSAQLLGDPNFPQILESAPQGERIIRYQELYQIYSRLGLSDASDRPRAINGLEKRLLRTMNVRGGFGIFDAGSTKGLLRRSLLWHRGSDTPSLTRISWITVPSWSWMAYAGGKDTNGKEFPGGINYFQLSFNGFDWEDIESPWSHPKNGESSDKLIAKVREFKQSAARTREDYLMFDTPADTNRKNAKCIILGIQKGPIASSEKRHYVLVVVPTVRFDDKNTRIYERVGAGYLPGRCFTDGSVLASIQ
ncbi:hypothetical protein EV356DRAFT_514837 [Viridothelium virens]|uniref:Protein kinase domain-containing protein n=1 Tax=Viridothelium virens TaxID=1048519 RepID=A0A6A6H9A2_VIRVR|nr:hypothetical protein EV356DRAFT_514837 [Viridothelium virens]